MPAPFSVGKTFLGKYRVDRVLGSGGMGVVVAATHLELDRLVAIKFLLPEAMLDPDLVKRFEREAKAAVRVKGEHVARVLDVGTCETGEPYLVVEYLEGEDLAAVLDDETRLPVEEAVVCALQACEALAEAHSLGIVHRDVKPANLFLTRRADGSRSLKVLDFGISKSALGGLPDEGLDLTRTRQVLGSPLFMSPEQMRSPRDVDARTDVWSLGVTLYAMLSGGTPFDGESITALCYAVSHQTPVPLSHLVPDLPDGLSAIVERCLEKERHARFADMGELATALVPFAPPHAAVSAERAVLVLRERAQSLPSTPPDTWKAPASSTPPTLLSPGVRPAPRPLAFLAVGVGVAAALALVHLVTRGAPVGRDVIPGSSGTAREAETPSAPPAASSAQPGAGVTLPLDSRAAAPSGEPRVVTPPVKKSKGPGPFASPAVDPGY